MRYIYLLSKTEIFCVNILWFIFILIQGTIVQKDIGIYSAIEIFFAAKVIWLYDIIPMPGGGLSLFILFLNLFAKLFSDTYTFNKLGTILAHIGIMFFLFGALFSFKLSNEGVMILEEGKRSNAFIADSGYSLLFIKGNDIFSTQIIINNNIIDQNISKIDCLNEKFELNVKYFYKNCDVEIVNDKKLFYKVKKKNTFPESEHDRAGVLVLINGQECNIIEGVDSYFPGTSNMQIKLIKAKIYLPFHMSLLNFEKSVYLKTDMAKSYKSAISIDHVLNIKSKFNIEMNKPFRFEGYTFYQTSFIDDGKTKSSIFTVVNNPGNFLFYLGALLVFLGLFLHLLKYVKVDYYE